MVRCPPIFRATAASVLKRIRAGLGWVGLRSGRGRGGIGAGTRAGAEERGPREPGAGARTPSSGPAPSGHSDVAQAGKHGGGSSQSWETRAGSRSPFPPRDCLIVRQNPLHPHEEKIPQTIRIWCANRRLLGGARRGSPRTRRHGQSACAPPSDLGFQRRPGISRDRHPTPQPPPASPGLRGGFFAGCAGRARGGGRRGPGALGFFLSCREHCVQITDVLGVGEPHSCLPS